MFALVVSYSSNSSTHDGDHLSSRHNERFINLLQQQQLLLLSYTWADLHCLAINRFSLNTGFANLLGRSGNLLISRLFIGWLVG
mmetsp:Transcript_22191/g.61811  ORF Transcript_22191/g.61811 Transcript_22191/m.61811 type:complete len:84 (-) Transcript_22191:931-1182(-)